MKRTVINTATRSISFIICYLLFIISTSVAQTTDRGFVHPGGLHTQEDFDRVKAQIAAGNKTVKAAFQKLTSSEYSQASVQTYPTEIIVRGGGNGENYMNATGGSPDSTPLTDSSPRPRGTQLLEASQL